MWVELFREVGFTVDDEPAGPVTLYRGSDGLRRRGMSWTTDIEQTQWFAGYRERGRVEGSGLVFKAEVSPEAMLAMPGKLGRGDGETDHEAEIIVDPRKLLPLPRSAVVTQ